MQNENRERIYKTIHSAAVFIGVPAWIATLEPFMMIIFAASFLLKGFFWWNDIDNEKKKETAREAFDRIKRERSEAELRKKEKKNYLSISLVAVWVGVSVAGYSLRMSDTDHGISYMPFLLVSAGLGLICFIQEIHQLYFKKKKEHIKTSEATAYSRTSS